MTHPLLEALDPEQRAVAEALRGPVRVLAGAGTGKTRAITHRIAHGVATGLYAPQQVLAVTFTARAAGEMRTRLRDLGAPGVQARTFHSAALRQVRYFWPRVYGGEPPQLVESKLSMLALAARRVRVQPDQAVLRDLASEVEWSKVSNVRPGQYAALAPQHQRSVAGVSAALVGQVYAAYEEVKREQGRMDMEDVLLLATALLAEDERVAAQVRQQYAWFTVDEFQDVSPVQATLLDLWLGGREELCVVGDPAQTIYSFAGATPTYLREFTTKHPGATRVELVRNYRSTPQVVAAANQVLAGGRGLSGGVTLRSQRPDGAAVSFREHTDEVAEAEAVAREIATLRSEGVPLREMAVLFRINAQSEAVEEALAARSIPYVVRGAARFFERAEVRQAVTLLRGAARGGAAGGEGVVPDTRAVLAGIGWTEEAPEGRGQQRDRWESFHALVSVAEDFAASRPDADLGAFVDDLDRRAGEQFAPVAEGVTLATMHAAKGLEWDAVFVCGVQEGSMPIVHAAQADDPEAVEEERRLLYVALTRARLHLKVSWSRARNPGQRASRKPSRFLAQVAPETVTDPAGAGSGSRTARRKRGKSAPASCSVCGGPLATAAERRTGHCVDCPVAYDEALFERLREWRKERASADSVPAYVVFTDATLQAIAERTPADEQALLAVNGVGRAKIEKYAEDVLALIADA
ncbi:ATP-dependent DNA helicase UvrD2 [Nocardioidaceae bacterium]|nr:ATP-dependent DNA helicase UvrD2 [Nocardioidaceae bacterium]